MRTPLTLAMILLSAGAIAQPAQTSDTPLDIAHLHGSRFLDSTWLVQAGDNPAWAAPSFADANWIPFDPYKPINDIYGKQRPGVIWYRLHLTVDPQQKDLALSEYQISRAFEVYANGERVMVSGQIVPFRPYTLVARLLAPIPQTSLQGGALVIALRVHISPSEWADGQAPGYYANNLSVGPYTALQHENWLAVIGANAGDWLDHLLLIGLGLIALVLFTAQRRQTLYLRIAALGLLNLVQSPEPFIASFRNVPIVWDVLSTLPRILSPYLWAALYFAFVHQRIGWRWRIFLAIAGLGNVAAGLQVYLFTNPLPFQLFLNLPYIVFLSVIVPFVLTVHWRRGNREAGILLVPAVLFSLYIYAEVIFDVLFRISAWRQFAIRGFTLIDNYPAGPFILSLNYISGILCTLSMAVIILMRSTTMSRRQALIDSELEAARQVQQVLVPEHIVTVPGFSVASVYLPAQQVGGDFFQIIPDDAGGLLLVVGDVAGKGLPAAMLVSVLVGSIRATADYTHEPTKILAKLNERLVGRSDCALSTALAAHIADDGWVCLANAGHLPPYLDGKEVDLPGALPLGVAPGVTYECTGFALEPGSRLTFYSDGVVEAQNSDGQLLGFERSRELSLRPAADIAAAAKAYGQQDDITVLTIERNPVPALA